MAVQKLKISTRSRTTLRLDREYLRTVTTEFVTSPPQASLSPSPLFSSPSPSPSPSPDTAIHYLDTQ